MDENHEMVRRLQSPVRVNGRIYKLAHSLTSEMVEFASSVQVQEVQGQQGHDMQVQEVKGHEVQVQD